jgi:hypothetical protein
MPDSVEKDWSTWDSTKPMDWSKPVLDHPLTSPAQSGK